MCHETTCFAKTERENTKVPNIQDIKEDFYFSGNWMENGKRSNKEQNDERHHIFYLYSCIILSLFRRNLFIVNKKNRLSFTSPFFTDEI